jgi:hypothetical protein
MVEGSLDRAAKVTEPDKKSLTLQLLEALEQEYAQNRRFLGPHLGIDQNLAVLR